MQWTIFALTLFALALAESAAMPWSVGVVDSTAADGWLAPSVAPSVLALRVLSTLLLVVPVLTAQALGGYLVAESRSESIRGKANLARSTANLAPHTANLTQCGNTERRESAGMLSESFSRLRQQHGRCLAWVQRTGAICGCLAVLGYCQPFAATGPDAVRAIWVLPLTTLAVLVLPLVSLLVSRAVLFVADDRLTETFGKAVAAIESSDDVDAAATVQPTGRVRAICGYMLDDVRYAVLPVLGPMLVVAALAELANGFEPCRSAPFMWPESAHSWLLVFAVSGLVAGVVVMQPIMLRWSLPCEPLGASTLRQRLHRETRSCRAVVSQIVVWRTRGRLAAAAVSGVLPLFRVALLTDRLLKELSVEEVARVYRHELAHLRCGHPILLTCATLWSIAGAVWGLAELGATDWTNQELHDGRLGFALAILGLTVISCMALRRLAHAFELQADAWAAERDDVSPQRYAAAMSKILPTEPRATFFHPSGVQRMSWWARCDASPDLARRVIGRCVLRRLALTAILPIAQFLLVEWCR